MTPAVDIVRTYLELTDASQLIAAHINENVLVVRRDPVAVAHYRGLYGAVGHRWHWHDRDQWPDERLAAHLASPSVFVWECLVDGRLAGFFELVRCDDASVEIALFGLVETAMGRGIGKAMLTRAVHEAWALGPQRVWLHTCTLDSPRALPNYLARGFRKVRTETYTVQLPEHG